jgi:hypothetical protein
LLLLLFIAAHRENGDGKDGDDPCFVFHNVIFVAG